MTGNLQIKNEKYYIVLNTYVDGKRIKKWISTGLTVKGNKRKAEKMLRDTLQAYEKKNAQPKNDVLFSDYVRVWLSDIKQSVDEVTFQGYEVLAKTHVLPYFDTKGLVLQKLNSDDLQAYFDEKSLHGRIDGSGGLSPRSLRLHMNIINQTINLARKNCVINSNPCEFVKLPKSERYEYEFYSIEEMTQLFNAVKDDVLYPLIRITALYGLRRSELLGLQWDSVDFENNRLTIKHTVSKVTKAVAKDKTKNASSFRSFPLTADAKEIFLDAKEKESENRKLFGKSYNENCYVFKWDDGHPFSPDYISKHFAKILKKNNLRHIRFHELRHSCASMLINSGFDLKAVQDWLGHADIKMTANIYGHLDVARKKSMAEKLNDSLFA